MQITLLSIDHSLGTRIEQAFAGRAEFQILQQLDTENLSGPGVIVLDQSAVPLERSIATAVTDTVARAGGRPVVLATNDADPRDVLIAIRAGAADVLPRESRAEEISTIIGRLLSHSMVGQARTGRLTLVIGNDAEASAMLATDIALSHASEAKTVVLLDCTLPTSACEAYLDLTVSYGIASAVADMGRLDASLLSNTAAIHEQTGLMLLTLDGGTGGEPAGLAANDVSALVAMLHACCDEVVFCAGNLRNAALLRELASLADKVEFVATQSIRELDAMRRLIDNMSLDVFLMKRCRLLLWDHQPAVLLDGKRMVDILGLGSVLGVPIDRPSSQNALNFGRPLALENDAGAYMQAIHRISGTSVKPRSSHFHRMRELLTKGLWKRRA